MKDIAHTIPDDQWIDLNEVVDAFFKFFTNPSYNGK